MLSIWTWRTRVAILVGSIGTYFAIALPLKYSYVPEPPGFFGRDAFQTFGPRNGLDAWVPALELEEFSDSSANPSRSPYVIYENGRPLGPGHSAHAEIASLGHGRFSHWTKIGFIFSSSDGTNPRTNGRIYRPVRIETKDPRSPAVDATDGGGVPR